jgi:hypothetical protein
MFFPWWLPKFPAVLASRHEGGLSHDSAEVLPRHAFLSMESTYSLRTTDLLTVEDD